LGPIQECSISTNCFQTDKSWLATCCKASDGRLASAWARLAAKIGEVEATRLLENEWECKIPEKVIEAGLLQKARFAHMS